MAKHLVKLTAMLLFFFQILFSALHVSNFLPSLNEEKVIAFLQIKLMPQKVASSLKVFSVDLVDFCLSRVCF